MDDFIDELLGSTGCAPDGQLANGNPVGQIMNTLLEGPSFLTGEDMIGNSASSPYEVPMMIYQYNQTDNLLDSELSDNKTNILQASNFEHMQESWNYAAEQTHMDSRGASVHMNEVGIGQMSHANHINQLEHLHYLSMLQQQQQQQQEEQHLIYHQQRQHAQHHQYLLQQFHEQQQGQNREAVSSRDGVDVVLQHASTSSSNHGGSLEEHKIPNETKQKFESAYKEVVEDVEAMGFGVTDDGLVRGGETEVEYQRRVQFSRAHQPVQTESVHHNTSQLSGPRMWARTSSLFQVDRSILRINDNSVGAHTQDTDEMTLNNNLIPYVFKSENPSLQTIESMHGILNHPLSSLSQSDISSLKYNICNRFSEMFEQGVKAFELGDIEDAIYKLEAALLLSNKVQELNTEAEQRSEGQTLDSETAPLCSEVWRILGQCHAEHDEDRIAIDCLERSIAEDPYNLDALLNVGVSYVNELDSVRAIKNLRAWIAHNPLYHGLEVDENDGYGDGSAMDEVMQLMQMAAQKVDNDPDVQIVLGVLYNVSQHYDLAVDAFLSASKSRPDDYTVWNKLGATYANANQSQLALSAYHRALDLKPKYARGWLNLGIAHANLGQLEIAVSSYLSALELNRAAKHIWNYTRISLSEMERYDLIGFAARNDIESLRNVFPKTLQGE